MQAEIELDGIFFSSGSEPERDERFTKVLSLGRGKSRSEAWFVLILPGNCII